LKSLHPCYICTLINKCNHPYINQSFSLFISFIYPSLNQFLHYPSIHPIKSYPSCQLFIDTFLLLFMKHLVHLLKFMLSIVLSIYSSIYLFSNSPIHVSTHPISHLLSIYPSTHPFLYVASICPFYIHPFNQQTTKRVIYIYTFTFKTIDLSVS